MTRVAIRHGGMLKCSGRVTVLETSISAAYPEGEQREVSKPCPTRFYTYSILRLVRPQAQAIGWARAKAWHATGDLSDGSKPVDVCPEHAIVAATNKSRSKELIDADRARVKAEKEAKTLARLKLKADRATEKAERAAAREKRRSDLAESRVRAATARAQRAERDAKRAEMIANKAKGRIEAATKSQAAEEAQKTKATKKKAKAKKAKASTKTPSGDDVRSARLAAGKKLAEDAVASRARRQPRFPTEDS